MAKTINNRSVINQLEREIIEMKESIKDFKPNNLPEARWKRDIKEMIDRKQYLVDNGFIRNLKRI